MKNIRVENIGYWSTLVGQLDRSKNSRSHLKNNLCCSLPNITPHNKFHPKRLKKYKRYNFRPRPQAASEAPQLPQTFSRKNRKPPISRMAQKIELVIRLFSGQLQRNTKNIFSSKENKFCLASIIQISHPCSKETRHSRYPPPHTKVIRQ